VVRLRSSRWCNDMEILSKNVMTGRWLHADAQEPTSPGWYPVLRFWDAEEGVYPAAEQFQDGTWTGPAVVAWIDQLCQSAEHASDIAYKEDPEL
jgi:hypothetical protein